MKPSRKLSTTVIALAALVSVSGFAMGPSTVSVRSGMLMGSVSGGEGLQGSLTTIPYLDGEFNIFLTSRSTLLFRSIIALDMATANLNYAYFGSGQRYYIGSSGLGFTRTEGGYTVKK
ncbi:MAG: hypothetical protein ABIR96_02175, partial [Bdellovibrionota bacterium]